MIFSMARRVEFDERSDFEGMIADCVEELGDAKMIHLLSVSVHSFVLHFYIDRLIHWISLLVQWILHNVLLPAFVNMVGDMHRSFLEKYV